MSSNTHSDVAPNMQFFPGTQNINIRTPSTRSWKYFKKRSHSLKQYEWMGTGAIVSEWRLELLQKLQKVVHTTHALYSEYSSL